MTHNNKLNKEAIFSDETQQFVKPYNPSPGDVVAIKLRTAKNNIDIARLHICGEYETVRPMAKTASDSLFDYYTAAIPASKEHMRYYFAILKSEDIFYYNKNGLHQSPDPTYNFRLASGVNVPEWACGAVMYHIFVDRFNNGDPTNDVVNHEYLYLGVTAKSMSWDSDVQALDVCNFRGGDLQGIIDKIDYLHSLGVEVIFLSPVFVSPSNHKYDTQDYDNVDPHIGVIIDDGGEALRFEKVHNKHATKYSHRTASKANLEASNALMEKLIKTAHSYGMRVILDGVFNHCGCFNKWMDSQGFYKDAGYPIGAYHSPDSPYRDYFLWHENGKYDGWWDNENHPKLNFEDSENLRKYVLGIAKKWVSPPYNADGWRLDVAADLGRSQGFNHEFWRQFRKAVKSANPEAIILAEHYGDASPWLIGDQWDTIMNYDAFMEPITWFLTGVSKHSDESRPHLKNNAMAFESAMGYHMARLNIHALQTSMNQLSNHDHSRFLTRTNGATGRLQSVGPRAAEVGVNPNILMEAIVFQMTWPGAPTIYYGDEAGVMGWTDPDSRRTFPWGKEDTTLVELHRSLILMRQKYPVLKGGSVVFLWNNCGFISYGRWDDIQKIVVAINNNTKPIEVVLPVWKLGVINGHMMRLILTCNGGFTCDSTCYQVDEGDVKITVPGYGAVVLG
ncbi:MAG: glycoside hydrolase family 13 protein [Defluviitaleaceae bacterium]|nr:glycoside hydrolase family 13 protein [Defluviitaleaceae bacterium]